MHLFTLLYKRVDLESSRNTTIYNFSPIFRNFLPHVQLLHFQKNQFRVSNNLNATI